MYLFFDRHVMMHNKFSNAINSISIPGHVLGFDYSNTFNIYIKIAYDPQYLSDGMP